MIENSSVPQPTPGTYIPGEVPPMGLALGPDEPPEFDEPPLTEPTIPVREPGTRSPARASPAFDTFQAINLETAVDRFQTSEKPHGY